MFVAGVMLIAALERLACARVYASEMVSSKRRDTRFARASTGAVELGLYMLVMEMPRSSCISPYSMCTNVSALHNRLTGAHRRETAKHRVHTAVQCAAIIVVEDVVLLLTDETRIWRD
jgi:hypothetical protein